MQDMVTIVVTGSDEAKVKELLNRIFKEEGYDLTESLEQGNVIRLVKKDSINDLAFIKEKIYSAIK